MANLTESLQTIYDTKIKIKAAIGTNSDIFTEYPELIINKVEEVRNGVTWEEVANAGYVSAYQYIDISENGEYNTTYSYMVSVNVEGGGSGDDFTNEDGMFYSMTASPGGEPIPLLSWGEGEMTYSEPVSANYLYDTVSELRYNTFGATIETFYTGYQPICQIFDHEGDKTWKETEQFGAYISYETDNPFGVVTFYNSLNRGAYSGRFKLYAYGSNSEFTSSYSCKGWCNWQIIQFDMS